MFSMPWSLRTLDGKPNLATPFSNCSRTVLYSLRNSASSSHTGSAKQDVHFELRINMNLSTISNVLYGHFNTKRNKLIWTGSLEDLKALVLTEIDEDTAQSTTWRSPSGGKWSFESKMLSITWHSKSKYIYFGREKGNDLLERIQSFLKQNEKVSDNGGIDESQLQKALESLLSDDSDDASIADDTS